MGLGAQDGYCEHPPVPGIITAFGKQARREGCLTRVQCHIVHASISGGCEDGFETAQALLAAADAGVGHTCGKLSITAA